MSQALYEQARAAFLSFPEAVETITWGEPHFRVANKIFGGYGEKDGRASIGFKLTMSHAEAAIAADSRFSKAPYVGNKGWVNLEINQQTDWGEVKKLIEISYRLIAPKKLVKLLDDDPSRPKK